jgi:hypothetical protein
MKKIIYMACLGFSSSFYAQSSTAGNIWAPLKFLGWTTNNNLPIKIGGTQTATFSSLVSLPGLYAPGTGLTIQNPSALAGAAGLGNLDLMTSSSNTTEVKFGASGNIVGGNNRLEIHGNYQGLYYNASGIGGSPKHIFANGSNEYGRLGNNNFWRIGFNGIATPTSSAVNAQRRLEVVDQSTQFRLSYGQAGISGLWTDFLTNSVGNLQIDAAGNRVGIETGANPQNTLHINSSLFSATTANGFPTIPGGSAPTGTSGVRLQDLTSASVPQLNPSESVLSVDANGDVILVSGGAGNPHNGLSKSTLDITKIALGQDVLQPGTPGKLLNNREVPMNSFYFHFKNNANQAGQVLIGNTLPAPGTLARLVVENDFYSTGQLVRSQPVGTTSIPWRIGLNAYSRKADRVTGVFGFASEAAKIGEGVHGESNSTIGFVQNIGGNFSSSAFNLVENNGARGFAENSDKLNIGGKFAARSSGTSVNAYNIGVYGEATGPQSAAGYFIGNMVTTGSSYWLSDSTFKDSIQTLSLNIDTLLNNLNPVSFKFTQAAQDRANTGSQTKLGFLAQQIEAIYPWMVKDIIMPAEYDTLGNEIYAEATYKAVDVSQLIPVLVSDAQKKNISITALKTQNDSLQTQVDALNARLTNLENCLSALLPSLCQMNQSMIQNNTQQTQEQVRSQLAVTLSNKTSIILDQNVPNPFAEQTTINFSIPITVVKAQIHFYNAEGKLMQSVDVTERGLGSLTVFGSDLSSGMYTYTLVADGQIVATKRMVKQ